MVKKTIGDALKEGIALLNETLTESPGTNARALLCSVLGCDSLYLTVHRSDCLTENQIKDFEKLINRCAGGEPLAYILNRREFMSIDFYVDENVLIPRPDTEILCEEVIRNFDGKEPVIIDMCTGSGAIAVSLAKYLPHASVAGVDISENALEIARKNAKNNSVDGRCIFLKHDIRKPFEGYMADCVVSNPPYIPTGVIDTLEKNVKDYEPHLALDGGGDGMIFYRAVTENIRSCLKCGGMLAFEVGCGLHTPVKELMENDFENIRIVKDLAGIERVVLGFLKNHKTV